MNIKKTSQFTKPYKDDSRTKTANITQDDATFAVMLLLQHSDVLSM